VQEAAETVVENVQEAAEHVVENVQEAAENVVENVQEAAEIIKYAFVEDLHEADEGDLFLLGMGLFRNLSILPGDVEYAAHHPQGTSAIAPTKDEESEDQFPHKAGRCGGWVPLKRRATAGLYSSCSNYCLLSLDDHRRFLVFDRTLAGCPERCDAYK
jgi:hypothetical protein